MKHHLAKCYDSVRRNCRVVAGSITSGAVKVAAVGGALAVAAVAQAQVTFPPITVPIDAESIRDEVQSTGGELLMLAFGLMVGFALVWKLLHRLKSAV